MGRGNRLHRLLAGVAALAMLLALACWTHPAHASSPPTPWDGTNPFNCTIQNAGQGTVVPDPGADPYCVSFDKTNQNITQAGIVEFLTNEPARTAAAVPKCFYFQEDHWRGTVQQGDKTAIYEFEGHYFFNKATGDGGVWITGFTVEGQTFDPTSLPGFPAGYGNDFGPGTGGFITHDDVPADPQCVQQAASTPGGVSAPSTTPRCVPDAGNVTRKGLGPLALGTGEQALRAELGSPTQIAHGFLQYCVTGGGSLLAGQPDDRSGTLGSGGNEPTTMLVTTATGFVLRGARHRTLTVGASRRALHKAFPHAKKLASLGATRAVRVAPGVIVATAHERVAFIAVYETKAIPRARGVTRYLIRSGA
jgi:hypothetical protein